MRWLFYHPCPGGLCAVITPYGSDPRAVARAADRLAGRTRALLCIDGVPTARLLLALFVGAALAVAGVLIQGIVRNPLASPDILGVNHAASLASVGALLLMPSLPVMVLPLLAFAGGMRG